MVKILVAGIGTGVGKTVVSAILTTALEGDYWKPVQCGNDTASMKKFIDPTKHRIFNSVYSLKAPLSPHAAARLEGVSIDIDSIHPPKTDRPLIMESVGGIFVPLTPNLLTFDLFKKWGASWILVSKHYLGSINHTLLTVDALKRSQVPIAGLIFNGEPNPDTENAILEISKIPLLGRLFPEGKWTIQLTQKYAKKWRKYFLKAL